MQVQNLVKTDVTKSQTNAIQFIVQRVNSYYSSIYSNGITLQLTTEPFTDNVYFSIFPTNPTFSERMFVSAGWIGKRGGLKFGTVCSQYKNEHEFIQRILTK